MTEQRADLVVVGAGTVGGWAAHFAAGDGAGRVVVLERGLAGMGASSRAAGIVRSQGGTETAVRLGAWSIAFYKRQAGELGTDSGFRRLGYLLLACSEEEVAEAHERLALQQGLGLPVRWIDRDDVAALDPQIDPAVHHGATYCELDGAIDPPRNVRAYSLALQRDGVQVRERTPATGLVTEGSGDDERVVGVRTPEGTIATERVLLTGGPTLAAVGALAGLRVPVGGARHQVAVTSPSAALAARGRPMGFDLRAGLYWREEEGGLLFGFSIPDEAPGEATEIAWGAVDEARQRLAALLPASAGLGLRKAWAATIDYTPDHLPILGPALRPDGSALRGVTIASAAGHGMMWGPAVARAAADLALTGTTDVVDATILGLDRFDEDGRSRLATDAIALPFPAAVGTTPASTSRA